jgi:hypothetical protein
MALPQEIFVDIMTDGCKTISGFSIDSSDILANFVSIRLIFTILPLRVVNSTSEYGECFLFDIVSQA